MQERGKSHCESWEARVFLYLQRVNTALLGNAVSSPKLVCVRKCISLGFELLSSAFTTCCKLCIALMSMRKQAESNRGLQRKKGTKTDGQTRARQARGEEKEKQMLNKEKQNTKQNPSPGLKDRKS